VARKGKEILETLINRALIDQALKANKQEITAAEIDQEIDNELISWRSLPGSDVNQVGSVNFSPVHNGGTDVRVILRYAPPAGKAGDVVGHLVGGNPAQQIADDLRRFKQVMEAAEVSSSAM
jgi:uncharacterized membrane protein